MRAYVPKGGKIGIISNIKKNGANIPLPKPSPIKPINPLALSKDPIFGSALSLIKLVVSAFDKSSITKC